MNAPFVLPSQTQQVYYTRTPTRKRDRPPIDWQVVVHTPARNRVQVVDGAVYQEEMLHNPLIINIDDNNQLNNLERGGEDEMDLDTVQQLDDTDSEEEDLLSETNTESEATDGYDSPHIIDSDSESDSEFH